MVDYFATLNPHASFKVNWDGERLHLRATRASVLMVGL